MNINITPNSFPNNLPPFRDPHEIPTKIEDFKEWHFRVLRRLHKHPAKEPFSGKMALEVNIPKFILIVLELELIEWASYEEALNLLKNVTLKKILKNHALKTSGNKVELIDRISKNINSYDVMRSDEYSEYYLLTQKGRSVIDESYARLESEQADFFRSSIELIMQEEIAKYYQNLCRKYAEMPFPPGLNVDWRERYYNGLPPDTLANYQSKIHDSNDPLLTASHIFGETSGYTLQKVQHLLSITYDAQLQINILTFEQKLQKYETTKTEYIETRDTLPDYVSENDVIWAILNNRIMLYSNTKSYFNLRNTYLNMALLVEEEKRFDLSLKYYCITVCFDISPFIDDNPILIHWIADKIYFLRDYYDLSISTNAYMECKIEKKIEKQSFLKLIEHLCSAEKRPSCTNIDKWLKNYINDSEMEQSSGRQ